jgi:hypothetical protein
MIPHLPFSLVLNATLQTPKCVFVGQLSLPPQPPAVGSRSSSIAAEAAAVAAAAGPPGIIASATRLSSLDGKAICSISASLFNTALLTADGEVYMTGSNDCGLLCRRCSPVAAALGTGMVMDDSSMSGSSMSTDGNDALEDVSWLPVRVEAFEPYPVAAVALGLTHGLAVTQQVLVSMSTVVDEKV